MRSFVVVSWMLIAFAVVGVGCSEVTQDTALAPNHRAGAPLPVCAVDPDATLGLAGAGSAATSECPKFWNCNVSAGGSTKICRNPGPDYPDTAHSWSCRDQADSTICSGRTTPDASGGHGWSCRSSRELVTCTKAGRDVPSNEGGGPWACHFAGEFRVCETTVPGGDTGTHTGDDDHRICYQPADGTTMPNGIAEARYRIETVEGQEAVHLTLTFAQSFVDNTYGVNSSTGYAGGRHAHTFRDLVGSDHAALSLTNASGAIVMTMKLDYISLDATAPSGYRSLGVLGGEGRMTLGLPEDVLKATSSLNRNLNERGCALIVDSPAAGSTTCANWDTNVVYEVWVRAAAFEGGFGRPIFESVHASPSRMENTVEVSEHECP